MTTTAPKLRRSIRARSPGLQREQVLWGQGHDIVVGMDEVGKGAWAGPLTLGAVVLPKDRRVYKVRDSKMLTESEREAMFERVSTWCEAWAVGHASAAECDALGMSEAQRLAARRALAGLGVKPDHVLIDGNWDFVANGATSKIVRGDATCLSIAAASMLAKVTRDRLMRDAARHYRSYMFDQNKGYPCPRHKAALQMVGPSPIHRRSWAFMDNLPFSCFERYNRPVPQQALF
ncbi:MAG: ribonuclease HII [Acidimicrobiales bacterium]